MKQEQERSLGGRFGAASHDYRHPDRWLAAHGDPVNQDLASYLQVVEARCQHEYYTSPFFRGVARTFGMHVVGPNGPTLQIQSDDNEFNDTIERAWRQVFRLPDPVGGVTGVDSLRLTVNHLMLGGASIDVSKSRGSRGHQTGKVNYGWQTLPFNRLMTPISRIGDPHVFMGIHFNADGSRKQYYFKEQEGVIGGNGSMKTDPKAIPAQNVQHIFLREEGEQVTGVPWMATAVTASASLAEYDADVMEANKNAARQTTWFQTPHSPEDDFVEPVEYQRGGTNKLAPGVVVSHSPATQTLAGYREFRHERLGEIGRAVNMPLILILLSAQGSNFSSAQYDGMVYAEGIAEAQRLLEQQSLIYKVEEVIRELTVLGKIKATPDFYEITFNWPKPPHANIEKIVKSLVSLHREGGISLYELAAYLGWDYETVAANIAKERKLKASLGIPIDPLDLSVDDGEEDKEEAEEEEDSKTNERFAQGGAL